MELYFPFLNLLTNTLSVTWLFTYLEHQSSKWSEVPSGIHDINFAAYFAAIISFGLIDQIFMIPQTQPLSSIYWSWRKTWQDNLRRLRVISRDLVPFCVIDVLLELRWWHKDLIVVVGDDCIDQPVNPFIFILSTAPETPVFTVVNLTGDVSKPVNQFYGD